MRILVLSAYYRPDGGPAAPLFTMLSEGLVRRGHSVTVLTTVPHYPSGSIPSEYQNWFPKESVENGVRIIRLPLPSVDRKRNISRLLQFLCYQLGAALYGFGLKYDVMIAHSPALEVWLPFLIHSVIRRKLSIYSVHDVYPDVGIKLGVFKNKFVIGLVTSLEKFCLRNASKVRILSSSFASRIEAFGIPGQKVNLIYDWVEIDGIKPIPKCNPFSEEYGLSETFNIIYPGNMGIVQGLDTILEAAEHLRPYNKIKFVFVGDGAAKPGLVEKVKQRNLTNVIFVPYQPRDRMPQVLASSDAALVILKKGTGFGALPSKTFSILASGRPVIASVDEGSDTWDLIVRSQSGICVQPESPLLLKEAVLTLANDDHLREQFAQKGREYVVRYHSPEYAAEAFEKMLTGA